MMAEKPNLAGIAAPATDRRSQRRSFLARCLGLSGISLVLPVYSQDRGLTSLAKNGHLLFVEQAYLMRDQAIKAGDQPYGAVVVKRGQVVGFGPSRVVTDQDPTAHAEMVAIRDAARQVGTRDLSDCILYSTSRPCRMCETAAYWANVVSLYFGDTPTNGGRPGFDC